MMHVIPYSPEHALKIKVREIDEKKRQDREWQKWAIDNGLQGPAYTIMSGDEIVACCGVRVIWEGVGEAWLVFSPAIQEHTLEATKIIRTYLRKIIEDSKLRRVQAFASTAAPRAARYLETLGFEREAVMRKLGRDGADHYCYAIVEG
ncbi:MAG: hypothetical protein A4E67_01024 [Syntrophaceae bacterium PtaB.Bin038]|nr:MAG: hypothetical protein A4E67_01024 [Syntrophaceae bacterium PtaB.Bin038]